MRKTLAFAVLLGASSSAGACIYDDEPAAAPAPAMVPAAGGVVPAYQAAQVIGEARCNREARCNNIGPAAAFASWEHCVSVLRNDAQRNLGACSYGVKDRELRACVSEIQAHACSSFVSPLDWFERSIACSAGNLCLR